MRGAGLQERFPNQLRVGVLIGYNYISSCTRKIGSTPTPLVASCSFCATNSPDGVRWYSVGPTHPVRASALWAFSWVSWGNIPHSGPGIANRYTGNALDASNRVACGGPCITAKCVHCGECNLSSNSHVSCSVCHTVG